MHSPAARPPHEHRAPVTLFSVLAFSQLQSKADRLPQEHVELAAHGHPSALRLQQVAGLTVLTIVNVVEVRPNVGVAGSKKSCRAEDWLWDMDFASGNVWSLECENDEKRRKSSRISYAFCSPEYCMVVRDNRCS